MYRSSVVYQPCAILIKKSRHSIHFSTSSKRCSRPTSSSSWSAGARASSGTSSSTRPTTTPTRTSCTPRGSSSSSCPSSTRPSTPSCTSACRRRWGRLCGTWPLAASAASSCRAAAEGRAPLAAGWWTATGSWGSLLQAKVRELWQPYYLKYDSLIHKLVRQFLSLLVSILATLTSYNTNTYPLWTLNYGCKK